MKEELKLRGIAWDHSRGFTPKVAVAQRFHELHPEIEITWEKRSLKHFGEYPVQKLAEIFDLLIIDHPYIGYAAKHQVFVPLSDSLPPAYLADQKKNSVGGSYDSYFWEGKLWALPVDAACAVTAWRPDLLKKYGVGVPETWEEVLALARLGGVDLSMEEINVLMNFYTACIAHGETPFQSEEKVISDSVGEAALAWLKELVEIADPKKNQRNPIQSLNLMSEKSNETLAYGLFPYSYSNYSRDGYGEVPLIFGDLPTFQGKKLVTPIGGTGIAISSKTRHLSACLAFAQYLADPEIQRTTYTFNGGQPAHRLAWTDEENNRHSKNFFKQTLPAMDRSYMRPRYAGYDQFQEQAGNQLSQGIYGGQSFKETLRGLNQIYLKTREQ